MKQKNIHNILVSILHPSEIQTVLKQATFFHEVYSASITLLLVIPKLSVINRVFNTNIKTELEEKQEAYTKLTLNIGAFYNNDIPKFVTIKVENGEFTSEIRKELKSKKYDLVILKESNRVKSLLNKLQAMSEKIISRIDCPVMILHEKWTKTGINEILIPLDVTKKCKDTILWAIAHSKKLGAQINFVSIVNTNINIENSLIYKRSILIKNWINSQNVECSFEILKSTANKKAQTLLDYAESANSDLIMILTHEEYFASNNYLGKFAKEIMHKSPKPVISMSLYNKPMFKLIQNSSQYGRKYIELLNLKEDEFPKTYITQKTKFNPIEV